MRLGVVSDLHHEPTPLRKRSWINPYDPDGLLDRVAEALRWFVDERVALIVVSGDVVELAEPRAFDSAFAALASAGLPVAAVGGNHDWTAEGLMQQIAPKHGVDLLEGVRAGEVEIVAVAAVAVEPGASPFATTAPPEGSGARVIVSHFPVLSEAPLLAASGLSYPGDLIDRAELEQRLQADGAPVVVLSGHIHARASRAEGSVLQLSAGAMIEPPYDAAIVALAPDLSVVERHIRRLGPAAVVEPVFAPEVERWEWRQDAWRKKRCVEGAAIEDGRG